MCSSLGAELCRDDVSAGVLVILEGNVTLATGLSLPSFVLEITDLSALSGLSLWWNHTVVELLPIRVWSLWRHFDRFLNGASDVFLTCGSEGAVGAQLIDHGLHLLPLKLVDFDNDGVLDQLCILLPLLVEVGLFG